MLDSSGQDSATVNLDFLKIPSTIETINYSTGIRPLPYWISALLFDDAASYTNLLGSEKTFYYGFPKSVEDYSYSLDDKEKKVGSLSVVSNKTILEKYLNIFNRS